MFTFFCKKQRVLGITPKLLELPHNASSVIRLFSVLKSESPEILKDEQQSLTLSYLINSCGLSPEAANVASKKVRVKSPEKTDLVLSLLRNHGLSDAHITKMIARGPSILVAHPEKTVLPKLEFFQSIGMPAPVLAQIISLWPNILGCSLEKCIIPLYEFLKNLLQEDDKVFTAFRRSASRYIHYYSLQHITSNIAILRNYGVSESSISYLVVHHPRTLMLRNNDLVDLVDRVVDFGIDISKLTFVLAMQVLNETSKSTWERRKELYLRWGWSESDIRMAFSVQPRCMMLSEKKMTSTMEFLVNEMNCKPNMIARNPGVLLLSLEKRIKPRCRVVKLLMLRGLIKESYSLLSFLGLTDNKFLDRFIAKHEHFPHVSDVYSGKLDLNDLGFTSTQLANFKLL